MSSSTSASSSTSSTATRALISSSGRKERHPLQHDDNTSIERPTFVTHLECAYTGELLPADTVQNLSSAGKPLLVRYDLAGVKKALSKDALAQRPPDLWRYRELLPVRRVADIVRLCGAGAPPVTPPQTSAKVLVREISRT